MKPGASDDRHPPGGRARRSLVLGVLLLAAVVSPRWLRVNVSPRAPLGLYRLAPVPPVVARGTLVGLAVPPSVQHVWSRWLPLLKPVAGTRGDTVCSTEDRLFINGEDYGPILRTAHGRPLPQLQGCLVVQAGEVFLASPIAHSLDSRYFGPVPIAALTAQATPLLTW